MGIFLCNGGKWQDVGGMCVCVWVCVVCVCGVCGCVLCVVWCVCGCGGVCVWFVCGVYVCVCFKKRLVLAFRQM